jgi:3-hydroxybutyryl-CoA dehydrogenase|tara:strand:+ start:1696 stop:2877 length:1182 start_codon:yes stop_codon:yes gene_type:complete
MTIGIIGSGAMGSGIAQVAAENGCVVYVNDNREEALQTASGRLKALMKKLVAKDKRTQEQADNILENIHYTSKAEDLEHCDLVIEAIVESLEVKKEVFRWLEKIVSEDCILATNTSSLSISAIAAACHKPERVIGIHFFNPAPLMPLVEIIPALQTAAQVIEKSKALIDSWGKVTVMAKDTPGFIVNRVARPFYGEALRIHEEGIVPAGPVGFATIDHAMREVGGFKMGPFQLMDFIGNDVNYAVTESVFTAFYFDPRYKPSFTQKAHSDAGWLGRKSGRGYFDYAEGAVEPEIVLSESLHHYIVDRIVIMLINEAADALYLNIASADDIDLAMTKGVNYPKGLLQWADDIGIEECVDMLDNLYDTYREDRYRCSPLLRHLADGDMSFHPDND